MQAGDKRTALASRLSPVRRTMRTIAVILGAPVPVILASLYFLKSAGLIDLSEHTELVELLQPPR